MNRRAYVAYDLDGHSSVSWLFKCKSFTFVQCSNLQDFNWHARIARSLSDSWASCVVLLAVHYLIIASFDDTNNCARVWSLENVCFCVPDPELGTVCCPHCMNLPTLKLINVNYNLSYSASIPLTSFVDPCSLTVVYWCGCSCFYFYIAVFIFTCDLSIGVIL